MSGIFDQIINYSPPLIVSGTVNYKGTWDASTNNPTLNSSPAASTKGDYYVVSTAGTQFGITFAVGDWIISNGTVWEKVDLTDAVSSVFGRTGAVVGVSTDYSAVGITNTAIGASNPSTGAFTTVSASTPIAVASGGTGVSTSTGTTNVVLSNSPTIVTPVIAQINDASGNETLKLASIASAVNEISIENAATGNPVHIRATGGDASVGLHLVAKGASGYVNVTDGVDETKRLMFNASGGTTNTRTMLSSTQTVDRTISLPDATGTLLYGGGPLGTPSSGTVTNLTGTASINTNGAHNGSVGATTPSTGAFTTLSASGTTNIQLSGQSSAVRLTQVSDSTGYGLLTFNDVNTLAGYAGMFGGGGGTRLFMNVPTGGDVNMRVNNANVLFYNSTGLAVTGTVSATGNISVLKSTPKLTLTSSEDSDYNTTIENVYTNTAALLIKLRGNTVLSAGGIDGTKIYAPGVGVIGTFTSTGLAVTGALSATDNSSVTKSTNGITSFSVSNVSTGTSAFAAYYLTNSSGTNQANIGLTGGSYTSVVGWDVQNALNISNVTAGGISIAARSGSSSIRNYIGDGTAAITTVSSTGLAVTGALSVTSTNASSVFTDSARYMLLSLVSSGTNQSSYLEFKPTGTGNGIVQLNGSDKLTISTTGLAVTGQLAVGGATEAASIRTTFTGNTIDGISLKDSVDQSNAVFAAFRKSDGAGIGSITRVTTTNAVVYNTTSDGRLKENLRDFTDSGRLIDSLKPRVFDWKNSDENGKNVVGFIAQEQHAADPMFAHIGAVSVGDEDPETITKQWQRSDSALIPILVAELKALRQRVAALEKSN